MSKILTYPSFLRTREGGFLPTNDALADVALRKRLTPAARRNLDRIAGGMSPDRLRKLTARLSVGRVAAGAETRRNGRMAPQAALSVEF